MIAIYLFHDIIENETNCHFTFAKRRADEVSLSAIKYISSNIRLGLLDLAHT